MSATEFIADFTEDIQEPRTCDRCNGALKPEDGHLIRSSKPDGAEKLVCADCCNYYKNKPTTVRVPRPDRIVGALPDPQVIRASVSAAQSRSSAFPPPVVAMSSHNPGYSISMPPPPLPRGKAQSRHRSGVAPGPQIQTPSVWAPLAASTPSPAFPPQKQRSRSSKSSPTGSLPPGSLGYGEQHLQYTAERARWANAARRPPNSETISLEINAVFEGGGKRRNPQTNSIGSICEGKKDVDAHIPAHGLAAIALELIVPRIKAYDSQFLWRPTEFVVRDKKWVNLSACEDSHPYFYNECLHPSKAKNSRAVIFKSGQFNLFVVVPEKQWAEYEQFKQKQEPDLKTTETMLDPFAITRPQAHRPRRSIVTPQASSSSYHITPQPVNDGVAVQDQSVTTSDVNAIPAAPQPLSTKRRHQRSSSFTSISSRSPPTKRTSNFLSPDRQELREALIVGGAKEFNIIHARKQRLEPINLHPIPDIDLDQLVRNRAAFDVNTSEVCSGTIRLNFAADSILGVGAFKTAQLAFLNLTPLRSSGLGSQPNQSIVIKHTYIGSEGSSANLLYIRPGLEQESKRLDREANVLYWAKALLKMTYNYIDHAVDNAAAPPPFEIPRLRFVDAGIILSYAERPLANSGPFAGKTKAGAFSAIYLAEELIPVRDGNTKFVKFIHNGDALPRKFSDPVLDDVAEFLSFSQHIQYLKTGGQVYISDYQGCPPLLTDPQILTHPDVGGGKALFADGNVETGVALFEAQHRCNMYCLWPDFGLHAFGSDSEEVEGSTDA